MIRSASLRAHAKQSTLYSLQEWIASSQAFLAMTKGMIFTALVRPAASG